MDIVQVSDRAEQMVTGIRKRVNAAVDRYKDTVNMGVMAQIIEDMQSGKLTTGDMAAIYAYRLSQRIGPPQP